MAVNRVQIQQRIPFVDGQGRLSNEGLRALNDAFGSLFNQLEQIAELYGITDLLGTSIDEIKAGPFILADPDATFASSRQLVQGSHILITDGGAGGDVTVALADSGVTAGTYGSASQVPVVVVDGKGVLTAVSNATITPAAIGGVPDTRAINTTAPLTGGGNLTADRTLAIASNGITDALLRQSAAFSVIGRSGNTTGNVADITAANDGEVLRRSGSVLGFGAVDLSSAGGVAGILPASKGGTGVTASTGSGDNVLSTRPTFGATLGVGGTAASASGAGISFPATQSPSTDANTLDDYEEGTWTPTVTAGAGAITAYTASGHYTKIGRSVECTATIDITTNGTGADNIVYTLPFTAAAGPNFAGCGRETLATGNMLQAILGSGGSAATVFTYNNAYPGGTGYQLVITMTYFV